VGREALAKTEQYSVLLESEGWRAILDRLEEETIHPARSELLRGRYKTREELAFAMGVLEGARVAVCSPYEMFAKLLDKPVESIIPDKVRRMFE
jgi:hypothetical protein